MINWTRFKSGVTGAFPPKNWNEFIDSIAALEITSFVGGKFKVGKSTTLEAAPGSGSSTAPDFSLYVGAPDDDGNPQLGITNGIISGYEDQSGNNGLPAGMTAGGDPAYLIGVEASDKVVWIEIDFDIDTDSGNINGMSSISIDVGESLPASTDTTFYLPLGDFAVSGKTLSIGSGKSGKGSQIVSRCGDQWQNGPG